MENSSKVKTETQEITWDNFKLKVSEHIREKKGSVMCRGQSDSNWNLMTSFHRNPAGLSLPGYFQIVSALADVVGTLENRDINTKDAEVNGSFLAYLQHHGFPTPLLDWSLSPYIAAYFAFSEVKEGRPEDEFVSIYIFDYLKWVNTWAPIYDYTVEAEHISVLKPKSLGNRRQLVQQGYYYTWTNVTDIEEHINLLGASKNETYLVKYNISVKEKFHVMDELEAMGITAFSLFGTTDSLCKHYREAIFRKDVETKPAVERMTETAKNNVEKSDE